MIAVAARGVTRTLPGPVPVTLVRDVDFEARAGEFVAVTGPSGSGKSSLLYLLGLLDRPTSGEVAIEGRPTAGLSRDELADLRLAKLGFVFQFHFLLPELSVRANVELPMRKLGRLSEATIRDRAEELLAALDLSAHANKTPDKLSGGQRQRAAIARAQANAPAILLADEPTGNLDTKNARAVFGIFRDLATVRGKTVICVTHDLDLATMATRRVHLVDGRIVEPAPASA